MRTTSRFHALFVASAMLLSTASDAIADDSAPARRADAVTIREIATAERELEDLILILLRRYPLKPGQRYPDAVSVTIDRRTSGVMIDLTTRYLPTSRAPGSLHRQTEEISTLASVTLEPYFDPASILVKFGDLLLEDAFPAPAQPEAI